MQDNSNLLSKIRTTTEAQSLRKEIGNLIASLYQGENALISCVSKLRFRLAEELKENMTADRKQSQEYLEELLHDLEKMELCEITLAFEPDEEALNTILSYIRQQAGMDVILDLRHDKKIFAGAKIAFRGQYKDLSLIQQFNQVFAKYTAQKIKKSKSHQ